jgi:hypothetical protein
MALLWIFGKRQKNPAALEALWAAIAEYPLGLISPEGLLYGLMGTCRARSQMKPQSSRATATQTLFAFILRLKLSLR